MLYCKKMADVSDNNILSVYTRVTNQATAQQAFGLYRDSDKIRTQRSCADNEQETIGFQRMTGFWSTNE